jgi:hypothetical protein
MTPHAIVMGHSMDGDIERIEVALREVGLATKVWFFDGQDREVQADVTTGKFLLCRSSQSLSSDDLRCAALVIHRVGIGHWETPVRASDGTAAERRFAEREWGTLLASLMLDAEERYPEKVWINRPSAAVLAGRKHQLLSTADLDGMQVARYRVSTENLLPDSDSGEWICKAINEDEAVDEERTFASTRLPDALVAASPFRTACPSLIQERVPTNHELRVYYLLGKTLALRLRAPGRDYVDIRLLPREAIEVAPVDIAADLAGMLRRYCDRHRLAFCVFDFLVAPDGACRLVDVTPGGSWSFYEGTGEPFVSRWYAGVIADVLAGA